MILPDTNLLMYAYNADAHLALALEHDCELYSTDNDFARFPGLRWRNPLGL